MFKQDDIIEFLTRIIKKSNSENIETSKESIEKFKEYLTLTTMSDENTINSITKILCCFEELVAIYEKTGICDLTSIFNFSNKKEKKTIKSETNAQANIVEEQNPVIVKKRTFSAPYQEKHYDRYIPTSTDYGSSCGSGNSYGSRC